MSEKRSLRGMLNPAGKDESLSDFQRSRMEMARRYVAVRGNLSDDDAVDIIRAFADGKSNADIAKEFGIDISVCRALVAYACDRDQDIYRRHIDPPKGVDPDPMSRGHILRRIPPLV